MSILAACVPKLPHGAAKPRITQFHTNLWSFRSLKGRRYVVDLGLNLLNPAGVGTGHAIDSVDLFLPFPLVKVSDVTPKLKNLATAELIFNETCQVATHGSLTHLDAGGKPYRLGDAGTNLLEVRPRWSRITVALTPSVAPGESRYVRIRAHLDGSRRVVWSQGGGLASSLTAYDIRFYEKRQWAHDSSLKAQIAAMDTLEIDVCQYFLIVPAASILLEHAPAMKYMRLLEAGEWEGYLDRKIERSSVYYWKHGKPHEPGPTSEAIGPQRPFRVYAKLRIVNPLIAQFSTWLPLVILLSAGIALAETPFAVLAHVGTGLASGWNWAINNKGLTFLLAVAGSGILGSRAIRKRWGKGP